MKTCFYPKNPTCWRLEGKLHHGKICAPLVGRRYARSNKLFVEYIWQEPVFLVNDSQYGSWYDTQKRDSVSNVQTVCRQIAATCTILHLSPPSIIYDNCLWQNFGYVYMLPTLSSHTLGKRYPFYGTQFHPEKNNMMWSTSAHVNHSRLAVEMSQYFANFFVAEGEYICKSYKPEQTYHHSVYSISKCIFANESFCILIESLQKIIKELTISQHRLGWFLYWAGDNDHPIHGYIICVTKLAFCLMKWSKEVGLCFNFLTVP